MKLHQGGYAPCASSILHRQQNLSAAIITSAKKKSRRYTARAGSISQPHSVSSSLGLEPDISAATTSDSTPINELYGISDVLSEGHHHLDRKSSNEAAMPLPSDVDNEIPHSVNDFDVNG